MLLKTYQTVKCFYCGKQHPLESKDYITIYGNICVGEMSGVIGNNFDLDGKLKNVTVLCREAPCLDRLLDNLKRGPDSFTYDLRNKDSLMAL